MRTLLNCIKLDVVRGDTYSSDITRPALMGWLRGVEAMTQEEAKEALVKRVLVARQHVTLAKAFILNLTHTQEYEPTALSDQFAKQRGFSRPSQIENTGYRRW